MQRAQYAEAHFKRGMCQCTHHLSFMNGSLVDVSELRLKNRELSKCGSRERPLQPWLTFISQEEREGCH
jgi:hypothetical protein